MNIAYATHTHLTNHSSNKFSFLPCSFFSVLVDGNMKIKKKVFFTRVTNEGENAFLHPRFSCLMSFISYSYFSILFIFDSWKRTKKLCVFFVSFFGNNNCFISTAHGMRMIFKWEIYIQECAATAVRTRLWSKDFLRAYVYMGIHNVHKMFSFCFSYGIRSFVLVTTKDYA